MDDLRQAAAARHGYYSMANSTVYLDIVPDQRIVLVYTMTVGDERISVSLATIVEAIHSPLVTHLRYTVTKQ